MFKVDKNSDFYVACEFNFTGIFPSLYISLLGQNITDEMEQQVSQIAFVPHVMNERKTSGTRTFTMCNRCLRLCSEGT